MNKILLTFGFCLVIFALTEANNQCRPLCRAGEPSNTVCIQNAMGNVCQRITECRMREENCRRRQQGQPQLIQSNIRKCRNLRGSQIGKCARLSKKGSKSVRNCEAIRCTPSKVSACYRSKNNECQVLTSCQAQRLNCNRGVLNRVDRTDIRQCRGMKRGQPARRCRVVKN